MIALAEIKMTLQEIAFCAMDYLDGEGVAAEYDCLYLSKEVWVTTDKGYIVFYCEEKKRAIERALSLAINYGAI